MGLDCLEVTGGRKLFGELTVQGSKNAVLPILAACMLGEGPCCIYNCPSIRDVRDFKILMERLRCKVKWEKDCMTVDCGELCGYEIIGTEAARIRSSVLFLGALLGRMNKVVIPWPGGCVIGERPIDLHIAALMQLGAGFKIDPDADCIAAEAERLHGNHISFSYPSVGATENAILAAVMADGITVLQNAAQEPEIEELCSFLNKRGAKICRTGYGTIQICGVKHLRPVSWHLRSDRIVTGTYLCAVMAAGGELRIRNAVTSDLQSLCQVLKKMGAEIKCQRNSLILTCTERARAVPFIRTAPYPGFPTDLQSPLMAVLATADGHSTICETVFENRFRTVDELRKMGACIETRDSYALIYGKKQIFGRALTAPDLRGGAALVVAALSAEGTSYICQTEYIDRGYEDICRDLGSLGAGIRKIQKGECTWEKEPEEEKN